MNMTYSSIDNQIKEIEESKRLENLKKTYKKQLKKGTYKFNPIWLTEKAKINFSVLKGEANIDQLIDNGYVIFDTSWNNLYNNMASCYQNAFNKKKLWTNHIPKKIIKVLEFWDLGQAMIPPILILTQDNLQIIPHDGKHRLAVCNYFGIGNLPVIISKDLIPKMPLDFFNNLKIIA